MPIVQTYTQDKAHQPLISFIIAYYNLPIDLLKECIDSILSLSLSDDEREIILVDDGSRKSPMNELMEYGQKIIYIRQTNQGLSMARNTGITIANGKYLQFVDGDDYLIRPAYDHVLDIARYHEVDIVMFQMTNQEVRKEKPTAIVETEFVTQTGTEYMRNHNLRAAAWGYLFKKNILMTHRFTAGILHEDEEFTPLLFLRAEKVFETNAVAYFYRQRAGSIINNKDKKWVVKRLNDFENIIYKLRNIADRRPEEDRSALQRRVAQLTMDYLYNIIITTKSENYLEKAIERLHERGLYPLPEKDYTQKYKWFRKLINHKTGRKLLFRTLLLIK